MSFSLPTQPLQPPHPPDISDTHSPLKLPNIKENEKEQDDAVEQAFDMDYDISQAFCSHIVPKAVLLFTGEALNDRMDFETEDGEGNDESNKGGDDEGGGGMGSPFPASAKMTGE